MAKVEQTNFSKTEFIQSELLEQINRMKDKMIKTGLKKGFHHQDTIKASTDLDQLIYTYQIRNFIR